MPESTHSIRRQHLLITADSEPMALTLQARLPDLNRTALLPVIARVLDEFAQFDKDIRIPSLHLDLGTMSPGELEREAPDRLEHELRRTLHDLLGGILRSMPDARAASAEQAAPVEVRSRTASRLEWLAAWLLHGVLPFGAPRIGVPSLETLLTELAAAEPAGLTALLRALGASAVVRERLVRQLSPEALERLISLLEPEHAELILLYITGLAQLHRTKPAVPLEPRPFERMVWTLVLAYLLRGSESQFNRKSFVEAILQGFAQDLRLSYRAVLLAFGTALALTRRRQPLASSLPAVIDELLAASAVAPGQFAETPARPTAFELFLTQIPSGTSSFSPEDALHELLLNDPATLVSLVRKYGRRRETLERLVRTLQFEQFQRLLHLLEPEHAALLVEFALELASIQRVTPLVPLDVPQLERLIWIVTLSYLLRDPGSRFNRKSYVRSLLIEMGASKSLDYASILEALRLGLLPLELTYAAHSSLLAILREIVHEDDVSQAMPEQPRHASSSDTPEDHILRQTPANAEVKLLLDDYDLAELLATTLRTGILPWTAVLRSPALTADKLVAQLLTLSRIQVAAIFARAASLAERLTMTYRAITWLSADDARTLLETAGQVSPAATSFWQSLETHAAQVRDRSSFLARVLTAMLDGEALDLEAMAETEALPQPYSAPEGRADIAAALLQGLRAGSSTAAEDTVALLSTFLISDPSGARTFLCALIHQPAEIASLAAVLPESVFLDVLEVLSDSNGESICLLVKAVLHLPLSMRPGDAAVREAFLRGTTRDDHAVVQILETLFGAEIPQELLRTASLAANSTPSPDASVAAEPFGSGGLTAHLLGILSGERHSEAAMLSSEDWQAAFDSALHSRPKELHHVISALIADPAVRIAWVSTLPESALVRLITAAEPRLARVLLDAAELLYAAWSEVAPISVERADLWSFLLTFLARNSRESLSVELLTRAFFEDASRRLRASSSFRSHPQMGAQLLKQALDLNRGSSPAMAAALGRRDELLACWQTPATAASSLIADSVVIQKPATSPTFARTPDKPPSLPGKPYFRTPAGPESVHYIANAGLILAASFLPRFFTMLEMTTLADNVQTWISPDAAARGVQLLEWLVDGRAATPEPGLVLNKLLCGLTPAAPVEAVFAITDAEQRIGSQLLSAMIANWTVISQSSTAALRETFLAREGRLESGENRWTLHVQRKTLDVLVDQIPWTFSVIRLPWMSLPLYVSW